jgi:hypothetical protein
MKISSLKDHKLIKEASGVSVGYMRKCDPIDSSKDPKATRKESYAIETFLSLGNVLSCMDQLHHAIEMLSGFRSQTTPSTMNRYDYIVFGIENYYLRLTSIYDRCLRLINTIFQIGIPERECRNATICDNHYIKGTGVDKALKKLDKFSQQFRFYRNTVAHESTYSEKSLNKLGAFYHVVESDHEIERFSNYYLNFALKI